MRLAGIDTIITSWKTQRELVAYESARTTVHEEIHLLLHDVVLHDLVTSN
jgi:hypothetical protein